jgi:hypothetical protein
VTGVAVRPVSSPSDLKAFIRLPHDLYAGNPNWVPPLDSDVAETLTPARNPFFEHAERELFLAEQDGRVAGRIAAIIDRNYNDYHQGSVGYFGFFESVNDFEAARTLFDRARDWLRARGITTMRGPANPSLNDEAGMLFEGFDSPPCVKMPYNPEYYPGFCERYGLLKVKDLYAYFAEIPDRPPEKLARVMERLKRRAGLVVRRLDLKNLKRDLRLLREVYNDAWSANWDFAPMTETEVDDLARKLRPLAVPDIVPIVEIGGEVAGIGISLPDYNRLLKTMRGRLNVLKFLLGRGRIDTMRLWALGVKRKFHKLGLDGLLYYETVLGARRAGYRRVEVSWILEDNVAIIRPIMMWGCRLYKKYRVYEIAI